MTINNTSFNPYPSSCALNSSLYSNNNSGWNGRGFVRCSQDTQVPKSKPFMMEDQKYWDGVQVPNGEVVPMGQEGRISMNPAFNQDLFQCMDGTIINIKTKQVLNNKSTSQSDCWGDRKDIIQHDNMWDDRKINSLTPSDEPTMTADDLAYQKYSEEQNAKLENNMNDLQKQLLKDLDNGKLSTPSRLKEER